MENNKEIAVIGAGVVGCAVACALAREGRRVIVYDRDEPGMGGASFGNAGHIATETVEPLPSVKLLFTFWKELFALGGPLDMPVRHWPALAPWSLRFAAAAFRREANTKHLAPLVDAGTTTLARWLDELGRPELLRRNGHYEIFLGDWAETQAQAAAHAMGSVDVVTQSAPADLVQTARSLAGAPAAAGLWYPESGHVLDPVEIVSAFAAGARERGAEFRRAEIRALRPQGEAIEIVTADGSQVVPSAVVCAGVWSAPFLAPFGLRAPLEAASGYHVEMPGEAPLADAPILFSNERIVVTPMRGRLRATSYMEFSGIGAAPDARKPARLRERLGVLGFRCPSVGPSWMGHRPVLPDYLPGIGRAPRHPHLFYCVGHHHVGLTIAAGTAELVADLVAGRAPRMPIEPYDLQRF